MVALAFIAQILFNLPEAEFLNALVGHCICTPEQFYSYIWCEGPVQAGPDFTA
jgi:hypothetical protein